MFHYKAKYIFHSRSLFLVSERGCYLVVAGEYILGRL